MEVLLRTALSFTHQSYSETLGSSEIHLKQQLVGSAGVKLGLAGSRAGSPAVFVKSSVLLKCISAKKIICSWKHPDSNQVLL